MFQGSTFFSLTERLGVEKYFNLLLLHLLVLTIYPIKPSGWKSHAKTFND